MLSRLESMAVRSAAVPIRLLQLEEEELPDEIDTVRHTSETAMSVPRLQDVVKTSPERLCSTLTWTFTCEPGPLACDFLPQEELLRTLASCKTVAPGFRWRRSRWCRACPVALKEGNIIKGKPEFSVG